jgi:inosine/xanthosine triphosphate pyrophosphatase family protein
METIIVQSENAEKLAALKAFLKALKIKFEAKKEEDKPYNPEFVAKILESEKQFENGQYKAIKIDELWK